MEVIEWLNENELRAYPLVEGRTYTAVPESAFLDLQLVLDSQTSPILARLLDILVTTSEITIHFTGNEFKLTYQDIETLQFPQYIRNSLGSLVVLGSGIKNIPMGEILNCPVPVEPATVYQFGGAWLGVSSINGNPKYLTTVGTIDPKLPLIPDLSSEGLTGDVNFSPGYNYRINFNNNLINMAVGFGYGLQMSCNTNFIDPALLDCGDIVSYINGVPPDSSGVFRFTAGSNIYLFDGNSVTSPIYDDKVTPPLTTYTDLSGNFHDGLNANTIFVGLTFLETDLCSPVQLLPTNN
jgi:hypothetical protein